MRVTGIGGGHGLAASLRAARLYADTVSAVVTVADDGGSSGRLARELGIPPPGDIRNCLVALADDSELARLFQHRFPDGMLAEHALGNLVIAALADEEGDFAAAGGGGGGGRGAPRPGAGPPPRPGGPRARRGGARGARGGGAARRRGAGGGGGGGGRGAARPPPPHGRVLPATTERVALRARVEGREVRGQVAVARTAAAIQGVYLDPPAPAVVPAAAEAIELADQVLLGPGSLFTSLLATLAVPGIRGALVATRARRVFVCNTRMQDGETQGLDAAANVGALLAHPGAGTVSLLFTTTRPRD
jgi:2-phospho-L-lactate transferase/gluconeogenesis factor (CofD/UPF0052 family)